MNNQYISNIIHNGMSIALLLSIFILTGCEDYSLSKNIDGKWEGSYVMSYDDGEKDSIDEFTTFKYEDNSVDDDGSFIERRKCKTNDIVDNGIHYAVSYTSSISGRYEVIGGDLYLKYDLSTLEVNLIGLNGGIKYESHDILGYTYDTSTYIDRDELKKQIFRSLWMTYKKNSNEDIACRNLKIKGDEMSYENEEGATTFQRYKGI